MPNDKEFNDALHNYVNDGGPSVTLSGMSSARAFDEGRATAKAGHPAVCPYSKLTERTQWSSWLDGYRSAQNEI